MKQLRIFVIIVTIILTMAVPVFAAETTADMTQEEIQLTTAQVKEVKPVVKAVSSSYTKIKVSWSAIKGIDGYKVYRATKKTGKYRLIKTVADPTATSYTNTKRITGKTYYYKVRAYKKIDGKTVYSKYSSIVSAYARPNKVKVTVPLGNESASGKAPYDYVPQPTWSKVSGATGYEVYRSIEGKNQYKKVATTTKTSWRDGHKTNPYSGYSSNKNYEYKVRAYRIVNGKKVYGLFSTPSHYVPDWTMEELMPELIAYGESIKGQRRQYNPVTDEIEPYNGSRGKYYTMAHFIGSVVDETSETGYAYVKWGDTEAIKNPTYEPVTPENSAWTAVFPEYIGHYWKKETVLKRCKELVKFTIEDQMKANPLLWEVGDPEDDAWWTGTDCFTIYARKQDNGYAFWVMH